MTVGNPCFVFPTKKWPIQSKQTKRSSFRPLFPPTTLYRPPHHSPCSILWHVYQSKRASIHARTLHPPTSCSPCSSPAPQLPSLLPAAVINTKHLNLPHIQTRRRHYLLIDPFAKEASELSSRPTAILLHRLADRFWKEGWTVDRPDWDNFYTSTTSAAPCNGMTTCTSSFETLLCLRAGPNKFSDASFPSYTTCKRRSSPSSPSSMLCNYNSLWGMCKYLSSASSLVSLLSHMVPATS